MAKKVTFAIDDCKKTKTVYDVHGNTVDIPIEQLNINITTTDNENWKGYGLAILQTGQALDIPIEVKLKNKKLEITF